MTRIPDPPDRAAIDASELEAYDLIMARVAARGDIAVSTYTAAMLRTPPFGAALRDLGRATRLAPTRARSYSYVDFELVVHTLGVRANFFEHHHILDALAQGVRPEALEALLEGDRQALSGEEAMIVDFAQAVVNQEMTDELWNAVKEARSERGVIELSLLVGFVWTTLLWQRAWETQGITRDEIRGLLRRHAEGALELPDPRTAARAK